MDELLPCKCGSIPNIVPLAADHDLDLTAGYNVWCGNKGCPMAIGPDVDFEDTETLISEWNNTYRFQGEIQ